MVSTFFSRLIKPQDLSAKEMANWNRWIPCCLALILFSSFIQAPVPSAYAADFGQFSSRPSNSDISIRDYRSMERARNKELSEKISSQIVSDQRLLDQFGKTVRPDDGRKLWEKISPQLAPDLRLPRQFGITVRPDDGKNAQPQTQKQPSQLESKLRVRRPELEHTIPDSIPQNWGLTVTHHGISALSSPEVRFGSGAGSEGICETTDLICQVFAKSFLASRYSKPDETKVRQECENFSQDDSLMTLVSRSDIPTDSMYEDQLQKIILYHTKCFSVGLRKKEREIIGILIDIKEGNLIGAATLLNDATLITARHVLYKISYNNTIVEQRELKNVRFIPAADPNQQLKIATTIPALPKVTDVSLLKQDEDQIRLTLQNPVNFKISTYPRLVSFPTEPVRLRLIGFSSPFSLADHTLQKKLKSKVWNNWTKYMVSDSKDACIAIYLKSNGCIQHSCSTVAGMSGAAIFIDKGAENDLEMLAVHSGTSLLNSTCEGKVQPPRSNVATMVVKPNI